LITAIEAESVFAVHPLENGVLLRSVRDYFRATDENSIRTLGEAVNSSNASQEFRLAAAHALASIHTPAALPFLVAWLDSPDIALRVEGVGY
jgi:HEAT repeats